MSDPMVLNDMAGIAILEERHVDAARLLQLASECPGLTTGARLVLVERAQEQARIAWELRYAELPDERRAV